MKWNGIVNFSKSVNNAQGNVRMAVLLSPVWKNDRYVRSARLKPLEQW